MIDPTFLGTVENVKGATITVALDEKTASGLAFIDGRGYRIGQVGTFVRIPLGYLNLFGIVSQIGAGTVPEDLATAEPHGHRWMTVQLLGEGTSGTPFRRGVSQYPTIGDSVHLLTDDDLAAIYGTATSPSLVSIGQLASSESIPALLDLTSLVGKHSAVLGSTGTGKSTTVAVLLDALADSRRYPSARILVLDVHGEYAQALGHRATVFRIGADVSPPHQPLFIPYWALTFDELLPIALGEVEDVPLGQLVDKLTELKLESLQAQPRDGVTADSVTVDTPVPFSIHRFWFDLHRLVNATHTVSGGQSQATEALLLDDKAQPVEPGDPMKVIAPRYRPHTLATGVEKIYLSSSSLNIRRQLQALASRLRDPRFEFLFRPGPWLPDKDGKTESDLDSLIEAWVGGPQPITILDLSAIPYTVLTTLIGALLRVIFDALFWSRDLSEGGRERPLLVVLEEAHAYLGRDMPGPAANSVRRIVKEGRKYGIGAMIVSQRPAEIDTTILSQCGTLFALRLSNSVDRGHVTGTAPDYLEGLFSMLPALRTGACIIVGEAVQLPMRVLVTPPPEGRRPDSQDPIVYDEKGPGGWNRRREVTDYSDVLSTWRRQDRQSKRIVVTTDDGDHE